MSERQNLGMESAAEVRRDLEKSHNDRGGFQNDTPNRGSSLQGPPITFSTPNGPPRG